MYFNLHNEFLLIDGEDTSKIINLYSGVQTLISKAQFNLINETKSKSIEEISDENKLIDVSMIIKQLETAGYGFVSESKRVTKTFESVNMKLQKHSRLIKFYLDRAYLELFGDCDLDCKFCSKDSFDFRTCGCKRWETEYTIDKSRWKEIIDELSKLEVKEIFICGGNPFKHWEYTKEILDTIYEKNIKIKIYTNGMNISKSVAEKLKELDASISIQLLAEDEYIYSEITGVNNSFHIIKNSIKNLELLDVDYRYMILVNRLNENNIEKLKKFCGDKPIEVQSIYPPNNYSPCNQDILYDESKRQGNVNLANYQFLEENNQCFNKSITIASNGDIYPCTMMRDFKLGNISESKLYQIFMNNEYENFWNLSKSKIKGCNKCSNRIGCFDCRALEYYTNKDLYGMEYCRKASEKCVMY